VAIPTNFQGYTPAANTTKSFKIFGSATVGIWANDVDGTLSATCVRIDLATNLSILMSQAYTDAQILTLLKDYAKSFGVAHDGAAGGYPPRATNQVAVTATTCT
jgi:hypothetical protein